MERSGGVGPNHNLSNCPHLHIPKCFRSLCCSFVQASLPARGSGVKDLFASFTGCVRESGEFVYVLVTFTESLLH
jgi:hypothetical protein